MNFEIAEKLIIDDKLSKKLDSKYSLEKIAITSTVKHVDASIEIMYANGTKEVLMNNGIKKRIYNDGLIII